MSAETATFSAFAVSREDADPDFDEELAEAAIRLLAGGDVSFKLSTRVAACELPPAKRRVTAILRGLPAWLYVPPALAAQRAVWDFWDEALEECKTADDQLLVMPRNRSYKPGVGDVAIECRPLDETDRRRTYTLKCVFASLPKRNDHLVEVESKLSELERRLTALERAKGIRCATGSAS